MKKLLLVLVVFPMSLFAQESYKVKRSEIVFTSFSKSDIDAINAVEDAQYKEIIIDKKMGQEDFELLCANLDWITKLNVKSRNKQINDVSSIGQLKNLEELELESFNGSKENPVDLGTFSELSKLKRLVLRSTKVTNTDALKSNTLLEELNLFKSDAESLAFLSDTPELKSLNLSANEVVEDYSPLGNLKKLEELNLTFNLNLTDEQLETLQDISSLKQIDLSFCGKITSLDFLQNNTELEDLRVRGCRQLSDFSALSNISTLKFFSAEKTQLKNLDDLAQNTALENFKIRDTEVASIETLKSFTKLKEIDLSDTKITDLSPLSECPNLRNVKLINCKIEDLSALSGAADLSTLILINTSLTDIKALASCSDLTYLEIQDTQVSDLSPLLEGEKLRRLTLSSTVPEEQLDPLKKKFGKLKVIVKD